MKEIMLIEKIVASLFAIASAMTIYALKKQSESVDMLKNRVTRLEENIVPESVVRKIIREESLVFRTEIKEMKKDISDIKEIVTAICIADARK